jgi:hypothetical protein
MRQAVSNPVALGAVAPRSAASSALSSLSSAGRSLADRTARRARLASLPVAGPRAGSHRTGRPMAVSEAWVELRSPVATASTSAHVDDGSGGTEAVCRFRCADGGRFQRLLVGALDPRFSARRDKLAPLAKTSQRGDAMFAGISRISLISVAFMVLLGLCSRTPCHRLLPRTSTKNWKGERSFRRMTSGTSTASFGPRRAVAYAPV